MKHVLLLHDTQELDLARDFKELLEALDVDVELIVAAPDLAATLQEKENEHFERADAAVFLLTPGSARLLGGATISTAAFPSPSVAHEMGQAKVRFKKTPGVVVYMVDEDCIVPAIDQKPYIKFKRSDLRSAVQAITQLVRTLKAGGVVLPTKRDAQLEAQAKPSPGINIAAISEKVSPQLKQIADDMAGQRNGMYELNALHKLLESKYRFSQKDINFVLGDLQSSGIATYHAPKANRTFAFLGLTSLGWQLVRYEDRKQKDEAARRFMDVTLQQYLASRFKTPGDKS